MADSVRLDMIDVIFPSLGVSLDVFRDFQVRFIIADDVFVIVALPDHMNIRIETKPFGNTNFKSPNN